MAQYVLKASSFQPNMVGGVYNIGLSDGTHSYGYNFWNDGQQSHGMLEKSDIASKDALVNYGSPNLVDRDLVFYPRITQGDYSGGGLQTVALDFTKYFDSDLEIRTPGYLELRPAWQRRSFSVVGPGTPQMVSWNNAVYLTYGGSVYYDLNGTTYSYASMPNPVKFIDTDGNTLIVSDGNNGINSTADNTTLSAQIASGTGSISQMWLVNQGTNGRFLYYTKSDAAVLGSQSDQLFKIDMTALPVTAGVTVPTNLTRFAIIDMVGYQAGIALLANDPGGTGFVVWYHDGQNMTPIVRVNQYVGRGITLCLGDLYVAAQSTGSYEGPVLMRIGTGTFDIVVRAASPVATFNTANVGSPTSTGQYVYFALTTPQINQVSAASYIGVYDAVTGSFSHLGNFDGTDSPQTSGPRQLVANGRAAAFAWAGGNTGFTQWQTNSSGVPTITSPVPLYASSGWMISSKFDFSTPGVAKRFRRITIDHAPLQAGEAITINAYVDQDPFHNFTLSSPPVPAGATVTNSTLGSTTTTLNFGVDTVGKTLFYTYKLQAGTNQQTTPNVVYVAVEVGGTWAWEFDLDCSSRRRLLNQPPGVDPQGVTGKDLYYLLRNTYENGNTLTLYLAEGISYTVAIESLQTESIAYKDKPTVKADEEWRVKVTMRQTLN